MSRRTFRYDRATDSFVEVIREPETDAPAVQGDIEPFVSPIDRSIVASRSQLRDHMGEHGVVPFEATHQKVVDRYAEKRERQALRERMWEYTDRAIRTGKAT